MALRDLDYQSHALGQLDAYVTALAAQKLKADKIAAANAAETDPDLVRPIPDFTQKAWEAMREARALPQSRVSIPFSPRTDGIGRPVPNVVFKVPTGGGKDLPGRRIAAHDLWSIPRPRNGLCALDRPQ